jgi:hypothetical protein
VEIHGLSDARLAAGTVRTFAPCIPLVFTQSLPFSVTGIIMTDNARTDQIMTFIREMNRCWTEGWNEDKFRQYIHADVVAIVPTAPGSWKEKRYM